MRAIAASSPAAMPATSCGVWWKSLHGPTTLGDKRHESFSKISPAVWQSLHFNGLPSDDGDYLYLYLLTNRHQNSAGCYRLPDGCAVRTCSGVRSGTCCPSSAAEGRHDPLRRRSQRGDDYAMVQAQPTVRPRATTTAPSVSWSGWSSPRLPKPRWRSFRGVHRESILAERLARISERPETRAGPPNGRRGQMPDRPPDRLHAGAKVTPCPHRPHTVSTPVHTVSTYGAETTDRDRDQDRNRNPRPRHRARPGTSGGRTRGSRPWALEEEKALKKKGQRIL